MGAFWSKLPTEVQLKAGDQGAPTPSPVEERINEIVSWAESKRLKLGQQTDTEPILLSDLVSKSPSFEADGTVLQWVNLVLAGGGMLGIAHVGFVRVLETAGVRFIGLGGASAGAINAALMAAVRERPDDMSWKATNEILQDVNFAEFEDGDPYFVWLRKDLFSQAGLRLKRRLWSAYRNMDKLVAVCKALGLHKGDTFLQWLKKVMANPPTSSSVGSTQAAVPEEPSPTSSNVEQSSANSSTSSGVRTTDQLLARMKLQDNGITLYKLDPENWTFEQLSSAQVEPWTDEQEHHAREHYPLRLVASEVATQSMIVFPRDADLFYADPGKAPPADFVRASMSVPLFFRPFVYPHNHAEGESACAIHDEGKKESALWVARNGFKGTVPSKAVFCDGGILSNFPVQLFVEGQSTYDGAPLCPTVGVRFGVDRSDLPPVEGPGVYLDHVINTSKNMLDRQFLLKNPMHEDWVAAVNAKDFNWLAFDMPKEEQQRLLLAGMEAGYEFLQNKTVTVKKGVGSQAPWLTETVELSGAPDPEAATKQKPLPGMPEGAVAVSDLAQVAATVGQAAAVSHAAAVVQPDTAAAAAEAVIAGRDLSQWESYKVVNQLLNAANKARTGEFVPVARTVLLHNLRLEERYNNVVRPAMDIIKKAADELGSDLWAYGVFLNGYDSNRRDDLLYQRRVVQTFWRTVQSAYEPKKGHLQLILDDWWTNNWVGRGREYRLLVEPLDIANYYYMNYHLPKDKPISHYIDYTDKSGTTELGPDVRNEIKVDNRKRPGRYRMLQRLEVLPEVSDAFGFGRMQSSLHTARKLKRDVGSKTWAEFAATQTAAV